MEKKKMKLWTKILIVLLIFLVIIGAIILIRFYRIHNINKKYEESNSKTNCYYLSEADNTIMEYYRKDGVMKLNIKEVDGIGDFTYWKDTNTGEALVFWNTPEKKYAEDMGGMIENLPYGNSIPPKDVEFLGAIIPMLHITTTRYEDKDCYSIKMENVEEIIEKETGLVLYSNNGGERKITYSFNTVTNEDVAKPDINEYKFVE